MHTQCAKRISRGDLRVYFWEPMVYICYPLTKIYPLICIKWAHEIKEWLFNCSTLSKHRSNMHAMSYHPTDYFSTRKKYYDHFKLVLTIILLMRVYSMKSQYQMPCIGHEILCSSDQHAVSHFLQKTKTQNLITNCRENFSSQMSSRACGSGLCLTSSKQGKR